MKKIPRIIPCIFCGTDFPAKSDRSKHCSKKCMVRDYYGNKDTLHICAICGDEFHSCFPSAKYCSDGCRQAANTRKKAAIDRRRWESRQFNCKHCGVLVRPEFCNTPRSVFCSDACSGADRRPPKKIPCRKCEKVFVSKHQSAYCSDECRKAPASRTFICKTCGIDVITAGDKRAKYCSDLCQTRFYNRRPRKGRGRRGSRSSDYKGRAKHANVYYEPVNRKRLFERDGWKCQICGRKTLKKWRVDSDKSPELDHRIPMSKGGPHTWENCQLACKGCNWEKGNRSNVGQMPLFAVP